MDTITLNYGGQLITIKKNEELFAVKNKKDAPVANTRAFDPSAPLVEKVGEMGEYELLKTLPQSESEVPKEVNERTLNTLRQEPTVSVGTHVYQMGDAEDMLLIPTGNIHVILATDLSLEACNEIFDRYHLTIIEQRSNNDFIVSVTRDSENPIKVAAALQAEPKVEVAEPDLLRQIQLSTLALPTDWLFREQWHLQNKGSETQYFYRSSEGTFALAASSFKKGADAKVVEAWEWMGNVGSKDIVVAVIDTAFDLDHPDLKGDGSKIYRPFDFVDGDNRPIPVQVGESHGTSCAGVAIAAINGTGTVGAAPNARFMPLKMRMISSDLEAAKWFNYAADNGADVISCSWGWPPPMGISTEMQNTLRRITTQGRGGRGCVICFAAGNARPGTPPLRVTGFAADPNIICVAASSSGDTIADYSFYGKEISVSAPSNADDYGAIITSSVSGQYEYDSTHIFTDPKGNSYTGSFGGTSSACPLVAGICALVLSVNPKLTAQQVKQLLQDTADKVTDPVRDPQGYRNGHSERFGYGRVNALKAVQKAKSMAGGSGTITPPITPTPINGSLLVKQEGTVNVRLLNVRRGGGTTLAIVDKIRLGDKVDIHGWTGQWAKIGTDRFVYGDYLDVVAIQRGKVNIEDLNVRSGPGVQFNILTKKQPGDVVTIYERMGSWLRIGDSAYVRDRYVDVAG